MGDCFVLLLFAFAFAVEHIAVGIICTHKHENISIQLNGNLPQQSNDIFLYVEYYRLYWIMILVYLFQL